MAPTNNSGKQREIQYDFFYPDLWTKRIDSIDDALDATFKVLNAVLEGVGGLSIRKLVRLLHEAGGSNYEQLVEQLIEEVEGDNHEHLVKKLQTTTKELTPEKAKALINAGGAGNSRRLFTQLEKAVIGEKYTPLLDELKRDIKNGVPFWHLNDLLSILLNSRRIPLSSERSYDAVDFEFQVKQLLNLYTLCIQLNSVVWGELRSLMGPLLETHRQQQTLPPVYLFRECFRHAGVDFEIIQRAAVQRQWNFSPWGESLMSSQAKALMVTDKLAVRAAAPLRRLLPGYPCLSIITFFSENTHIHHLPYSDQFVLIGLSYDHIPLSINKRTYPDQNSPSRESLPAFELMAIPHEMGHYMYHHAQLDDHGKTFADVGEEFKGEAYHQWCEEIFADIYGCMVAGALAALGMQALLATGDKERVWKYDEEHPTPVVRPFILSEILRVLSEQELDRYQFGTVATHLDANWAALLQRWGLIRQDSSAVRPLKVISPKKSNEEFAEEYDVEMVLQGVRPMINKFTNLLIERTKVAHSANDRTHQSLPEDIPWSHGNVATLEAYDQMMADLTSFDFGSKPVSGHIIVDIDRNNIRSNGKTVDERLRDFLDGWGDSGPNNGSVGT